jgi:threonine dehydrogenase-like Zn-dependent dehydrogenase
MGIQLPAAHVRVHATPPSLAVFGAGTVGIGSIVAARLNKLPVIVAIEPIEHRRALAKEAGATHVIDPSNMHGHELSKKIKMLSPGQIGVDLIIEACAPDEPCGKGGISTFKECLHALGPKGHACMVGASHPGVQLRFDPTQMMVSVVLRRHQPHCRNSGCVYFFHSNTRSPSLACSRVHLIRNHSSRTSSTFSSRASSTS